MRLEAGPLVLAAATCTAAALLAAADRPVLDYLRQAGYQAQPLGQSPAEQALYGVLWFAPTVAMTFLLAYGARRRKGRALALGAMVSVGFTSFWVLAFAYWWAPFLPTMLFVLGSAALYVLAVYGRVRPELGAPFQVWLAVGFGVLVVLALPSWSVLAMLLFAAAWDWWAVFRGPLGGMVSAMKVDESTARWFGRALTVRAGGRAVGLGDLTFYSALVALGGFSSGPLAFGVYVSVMLGVAGTFWLMGRRRWPAAPGLPLPVALSACVIAAAVLLGAPL